MRLSSLIANASPVAGIIISVALMLFSGFAMTRLTKLARLPNVTGYILAGILIGPYVLNLCRSVSLTAQIFFPISPSHSLRFQRASSLSFRS